eukprot:1161602-Pelagomonas_calceolata.AAC.10
MAMSCKVHECAGEEGHHAGMDKVVGSMSKQNMTRSMVLPGYRVQAEGRQQGSLQSQYFAPTSCGIHIQQSGSTACYSGETEPTHLELSRQMQAP